MTTVYDSITNRGEYFAAHFFPEELPDKLRKGVFAAWATRESDENDKRKTPRQLLRTLRAAYFAPNMRAFFAERAEAAADALAEGRPHAPDADLNKRLGEWHQEVLAALGFLFPTNESERQDRLIVYRSGKEHEITVAWHGHGIVALDCGWTASTDAALDEQGAARLVHRVRVSASERYETGPKLASWLFGSEIGEPGKEAPPRFVLLLCGGVIMLADAHSWAEGRFLAANLDIALERNDTRQTGELATIAALFAAETLTPAEDGTGIPLDTLLKASTDNAVPVNKDLRAGLQRSVEIIANEVLARLRTAGVEPAEIEDPKVPFAKQLTSETLRYLYRILFLLYAEARPELRILPADDSSYELGYSVARLRDLVERDAELVETEAREGFHLYESLDLLFTKVNAGHRRYGTEPDDEQDGDDEQTLEAKAKWRSEDRGLRFEALRSELFEPAAITLIGRRATENGELDLRPRNAALHRVLRLLTMKRASARGRQGGFISYRNLGINQLGAVYEGLMSYTGIIASEKLCEVAKNRKPEQGSWLIPARRQGDYPDGTLVKYGEEDARHGLRGPKTYDAGTFVYRLAGRDRETSASYYTPESLTKVTVELALKHWLNQDGVTTRAADLLELKICEPALGSGAFLNEAINQVAEEYLRRRQAERGISVPTEQVLEAKQRVKAYIALHNAHGVDLNATGVELAEVSLWLNTMYPGMQAPWFGLHLRRGNSLIGARRAVYSGKDVPGTDWLRSKDPLGPDPLPFLTDGQPNELPPGAVHQFLLPNPGWAAVHGSKEAKQLTDLQPLKDWRRGILKPPTTKGGQKSQAARLASITRRVEFLWQLVIKRMAISEEAIARRIDVWGADPADPEFAFLRRPMHATPKEQVLADLFNAPDTPYWRLKKVMDAWCALWFWPNDGASIVDGTDPVYAAADDLTEISLGALLGTVPEPTPLVQEQGVLFDAGPTQRTLELTGDGEMSVERKEIKRTKQTQATQKLPKRERIPLANMDNWLEFLEAMLGTHDVPEGGLFLQLTTLDQLKDYENQLPAHMGMYRGDPEHRFPWLHTVQEIAEEQGFLHWELEFALVFGNNGGFDLQVGNPPWTQPEWNEDSVLAEHEPLFMLAADKSSIDRRDLRKKELEKDIVTVFLLNEITSVHVTSMFISSPQIYPLLARGQPDLYRAFMATVWQNASAVGVSGLVHPDTHFSGKREGELRTAAYRRLRVHGDFVNAGNRFFPSPVGRSSHFGVHIYGRDQDIDFGNLSWLFSVDSFRLSLFDKFDHEVPPGVKYQGSWDVRPDRKRVIGITRRTLIEWQELTGAAGESPDGAELLTPVSVAELSAIETLRRLPKRLVKLSPSISRGYDETEARKAIFGRKSDTPIIESNRDMCYGVSGWSEVILTGPQLGLGNPYFKQPSQGKGEVCGLNPLELAEDSVPESVYRRVLVDGEYQYRQEKWSFGDKLMSSTDFYRSAWRERIAFDTERALYVSIIPPGADHVHGVRSAWVQDEATTSLLAGLWGSLPVDYLLRIAGVKHLDVEQAKRMPAPDPDHPLANALLLRTLRLNCLTTAYADLWNRVFDPSFANERWAVEWFGLEPLNNALAHWCRDTALRSERARRSALVEIDAIGAVWLGISAESLVTMYRARFPIMQDFDGITWFDSAGRKLSGDRYTYGHGQTRDHWTQYQDYLADPDSNPIPDGFTAPFYKADREAEMREAHAVFQARLDAAIAAGEWDPDRHEVPAR